MDYRGVLSKTTHKLTMGRVVGSKLLMRGKRMETKCSEPDDVRNFGDIMLRTENFHIGVNIFIYPYRTRVKSGGAHHGPM